MADTKVEVELRAKIDQSFVDNFPHKEVSSQHEHDLYYKFLSQPENDWIARVRQRDNQFILTFKSKKTFGEGAWSEVNIPIDQAKAEHLTHFFLENGFFVEVEINKKRKTYHIDEMEVNIDEIENLGVFIEAEVMVDKDDVEKAKEKITRFFSESGIDQSAIITKGYVGLVKESKNGNS